MYSNSSKSPKYVNYLKFVAISVAANRPKIIHVSFLGDPDIVREGNLGNLEVNLD